MKTSPEVQPIIEAGISDALANATANINAGADRDAPETAVATTEQAPQPPAPFVYNTETTEVARTFINQIDRLERLISEDDEELRFLDGERDRQMSELTTRYEQEQDALLHNHQQATEIVNARRADRNNARRAIHKTVVELQDGK